MQIQSYQASHMENFKRVSSIKVQNRKRGLAHLIVNCTSIKHSVISLFLILTSLFPIF